MGLLNSSAQQLALRDRIPGPLAVVLDQTQLDMRYTGVTTEAFSPTVFRPYKVYEWTWSAPLDMSSTTMPGRHLYFKIKVRTHTADLTASLNENGDLEVQPGDTSTTRYARFAPATPIGAAAPTLGSCVMAMDGLSDKLSAVATSPGPWSLSGTWNGSICLPASALSVGRGARSRGRRGRRSGLARGQSSSDRVRAAAAAAALAASDRWVDCKLSCEVGVEPVDFEVPVPVS